MQTNLDVVPGVKHSQREAQECGVRVRTGS